MITRLILRVKGAIAWLIGAALIIGGIYAHGRSTGRHAERARQRKAHDKLQEHYDEIDRRPRDFDGAVERLRDRSRRW